MEESTFPLKPIAGVAVLIAVVGGGIYWFFTLPVAYIGPEGYEVFVPREWEVKPGDGGMSAGGPLDGKNYGTATASFHPTRVRIDWPNTAIDYFGVRPDEYKTGETIDGRPAVILIFQNEAQRFLAAVIDRGDGLIVYKIGCASEAFEANRPLFERMARRTQCGKP